MFLVAICNTCDGKLSPLYDKVQSYVKERHIIANIVRFNTPELLLLSQKEFDLYFLDIGFPCGISGIDIGKQIRARHPKARLVYIADDNSKALEAYQIQACYYALHSIPDEELFTLLDNVKASMRSQTFIVQTVQGERKLKISDLLFVSIEGRYLCYNLKNEKIMSGTVLRTSFEKATAHLHTNDAMLFIPPGFLVNVENIKYLNKDNIVFENGTVYYMPKTFYEQVRKKWEIT